MHLPAAPSAEADTGRRAVDGDAVVVLIARTRGSTPRGAGARIRVGRDHSVGSIGGGHLEYEAIRLARLLPAGGAGHLRVVLGASLGQCCGGEVELAFVPAARLEAAVAMDRPLPLDLTVTADRKGWRRLSGEAGALAAPDRDAGPVQAIDGCTSGVALVGGPCPHLVFGAERPGPQVLLCGGGHVGVALARLLAPLDCRLDWVDGRDDRATITDTGPLQCRDADPVMATRQAPAGTHLLVMTHDHGLDYAIVSAALRRGDLAFVGLIGSMTKRRRFEHRLRQDGCTAEQIAGLRCPLGLTRVRDKSPAAIAILVAAELLSAWDAAG